MKVSSLTDVPTESLKHQGLVGASVRVGHHVIPSGATVELRGTSRERADVAMWLRRGALTLTPRKSEPPVSEAAPTLRATHPTIPPEPVVIPWEPPPPAVELIETASDAPPSDEPYGTLVPESVLSDVAAFSRKNGKKRRR